MDATKRRLSRFLLVPVLVLVPVAVAAPAEAASPTSVAALHAAADVPVTAVDLAVSPGRSDGGDTGHRVH